MTKTLTLVLATHNRDKVRELSFALAPLADALTVFSIDDLAAQGYELREVDETEPTLEGNADKKARDIYKALAAQGLDDVLVLSDDTGLEVDALGGAPGVYSARYATAELGRKPTYAENVEKLLRDLSGKVTRTAQFRTVLSLVGKIPQHSHVGKNLPPSYFERRFEGVLRGEIALAQRGKNGFGYDPIFELPNTGKTLAELSLAEKNTLSHRARALTELLAYFQTVLIRATP